MRNILYRGSILALFASASGLGTLLAQSPPTLPDSETLVLAHRLLDATHADSLMLASIHKLFESMRQTLPPHGPALVDSLEGWMTRSEPELLDTLAVVYANSFSADDLRGLLAFYQTPLGQRLLQAMPTLMSESMAASQRFAMRLWTAASRTSGNPQGRGVGPN